MGQKKEILKDAGLYTILSYLSKFLDILNSILIRRFLGPASMGVWALLQVVVNYAKHSVLGIPTALNRDVPYYNHKGETKKAEEVANAVFSFSTFAVSLVAIGVAFFALASRSRYPSQIIHGLYVVAMLVILQRVYNLFVALLRANKKFHFAGWVNIISSVLSVFLTILLTARFKLYGLLASVVIHYIVMIGFLFWATGYRFKFVHPIRGARPFLGLGIAMLISEVLRTVFMSIDRIMVVKYLGFELLGIYSIALMAQNYLHSLPAMMNVVLFPRFQEAFSKSDEPQDLHELLRQPTLCISYLFPILIGLIWILSPTLITIFLPRFTPGIPALKILILGSFFLGLNHNFTTFIVSARNHWVLVPIQGMLIGVGFVCTWIAIQLDYGLWGVAIATSITYAFLFLTLSFMAMRTIYSFPQMIGVYARIFLSLAYVATALFLADYLWHYDVMDFGSLMLRCSFFLIYSSPLLLLADRETGAICTLMNLMFVSFKRLRR